MPRKDTNPGPISAQAQQDLVSEGIENFELPKSIVTKIAKSAIPENAKLQKETVLSLVKGSTVFINYLAATAHDVALSKQHKSISASDVLKALEMIEFGDLVDKLQEELLIYRELAKTDKSKKGTSNITTVSAPTLKVKPPLSPGKPKGKEKERATGPMLPPFTSVPLGPPHGGGVGSISSGPGTGVMDVDEDMGEGEGLAEDYEREGEVEGVDGEIEGMDEEDEEIEEDEDEEGPEEEVHDPMAVEDEEIRRDAKGLEEPEQAVVAND